MQLNFVLNSTTFFQNHN